MAEDSFARREENYLVVWRYAFILKFIFCQNFFCRFGAFGLGAPYALYVFFVVNIVQVFKMRRRLLGEKVLAECDIVGGGGEVRLFKRLDNDRPLLHRLQDFLVG